MIDRPVIIAGAPRSGTTLLFELLSGRSDVWSIGTESGRIIERVRSPSARNWESGELGPSDLGPDEVAELRREFELRSASGRCWAVLRRGRRAVSRRVRGRRTATQSVAPRSSLPRRVALRAAIELPHLAQRLIRPWRLLRPVRRPVRFVEKTPENSLRLPALIQVFPDACVVHVVRSGPQNIASLMAGWRHPHLFDGYEVPERIRIPGVERQRWAFTLIPGWRDLLAEPLERVCAQQWIECNAALLDARDTLDVPWLTVRHEDLVERPADVLAEIDGFADLAPDARRWARDGLPVVNALSPPDPEKWRREPGIVNVLSRIEPMMRRLGYPMPSVPVPAEHPPDAPDGQSLR